MLYRVQRCKSRTPLQPTPEIVEPEADSSTNTENDVPHVDVEGCQYAVVQREPRAAASGRPVRIMFKFAL